jgi:hypothetical protein
MMAQVFCRYERERRFTINDSYRVAVEIGRAIMYNTSLSSLFMKANDIRSVGVGTISTGLKKNIGLISLDLSDNDIGDRYTATHSVACNQ